MYSITLATLTTRTVLLFRCVSGPNLEELYLSNTSTQGSGGRAGHLCWDVHQVTSQTIPRHLLYACWCSVCWYTWLGELDIRVHAYGKHSSSGIDHKV
jgi:hypothetical protein